MRLFVAVPMSDMATRELSATVERMRRRAGAEELRWSSPESWHVTLQFLGSADAVAFDCLLQQLRKVQAQPVKIVSETVGSFARAGVLHIGVKPTPQLLQLEKQISAATARCGFVREDRPYHPHITLARTRGRGGRYALSALVEKSREVIPFTAFTAGEFALYESVPGGAARYEIREHFPLG